VELLERGELLAARAVALVVRLPPNIAERELAVVKERMGWDDEQLRVATSNNAHSPGNVLTIELESEQLTEIFTGVGERGVRAEVVAERAAAEALRYLSIDAPVGEHLADQLLIPLALTGGGSFLTGPPSLHTTTNIEIIKRFLAVEITVEPASGGAWKVEVLA
jgi:RNA 3'-terminal phosphate cyclase (ATP)